MLVLVLATACGGAGVDEVDTTVGSDGDHAGTSEPADTTTSTPDEQPESTEAPDTTRGQEETDSATADLPLAPDFTLELGSGGEYTLSDTDNPVYLVFWAEW